MCPSHTGDECYCHDLLTGVCILAVAISRSNSDNVRPTLGVWPYDLPTVGMSSNPADLQTDRTLPVVRQFSILCLMCCKIQRRKRLLRSVLTQLYTEC
jgi:hypothetical protein